jgi:hypothetical protein
MPVQKRTLSVQPNPWLYIDHKGRPAARVAVEQPTNGTYDPRTVGSRIADAKLVSSAPKGAPLAHDIHDLEVEYSKEPVEVRNSAYYRRAVMDGELVAADRESFVAAGGSPRDFESYRDHIEKKRVAAIKQFDLENGEGAFEALAAQRAEDEKALGGVPVQAAVTYPPIDAPAAPQPEAPVKAQKGDKS